MTTAKKTAPKFTAAERAAMKERAQEERSTARGAAKKAEEAQALHDKIAEMPPADRALASRVHEIVTAAAPDLDPKTWYGMPAWARNGKIVCFFQPASKFDYRYATLGFQDTANLDEGSMWPTTYALTELTDAAAKRVEELVKRAVS